MSPLKNIATYILLWVYALSFGHQIIPHHHYDKEDHIYLTGADNHKAEGHNHVQHENHFDEGFINYLACILAHHSHNPATECEYADGFGNHKKGFVSDNLLAAISIRAFVLEPLLPEQNKWKPKFSQKRIQNLCFGQIETRGSPLV